MTFRLTKKQELANQILGSDATHCMLYGGSRSGKTFVLVRAVLTRALAYKSRHAMLRYRFNHIKASIVYDTLPKVMELCFPGVSAHCKLDKTDWFYTLPNGSEVWFGGLDDKERTEKILGQEYTTIYMNECSQIPWASRNMAITRLAQNVQGLRLKAYYDCNPPGMAHWTYRLFMEKRDPDRRTAVINPGNYAALLMNPKDNEANLSASYLEELQNMSEAMRRRFLLGQFADMSESSLWTMELLDQQRIVDGKVPDMVRIVVAVDPSGAAGEEDTRSDEIGIVVCGLGKDGRGYILEDISGRMAPAMWGKAAVSAFDRWEADAIVAEENFGGAMVAEVIRGASSDPERKTGGSVPYRAVKASRGKIARAEPIAALFEQQKVSLVGHFPEMEDQLCVAKGTLIETDRGFVPIENVTTHDRVMTRTGFAPIREVGYTRHASQLVEIGAGKCRLALTGNHPVYVTGRGAFVAARHVLPSDSLLVSHRWESMEPLSRGEVIGTIECLTGTSAMQRESSFIGWCIKRTSGRLKRALISITSMEIRAIMSRIICWQSQGLSTLVTTRRAASPSFAPNPLSATVRFVERRLRPSEMCQTGIALTIAPSERIGLNRQSLWSTSNVSGAGREAPTTLQKSSVAAGASPVTTLHSIENVNVPVYNLSVDDGYLPEYFANGILVHNCAMTTAGYVGSKSPDRGDAAIWGIASLFPAMTKQDPANVNRRPAVNIGYAKFKKRR